MELANASRGHSTVCATLCRSCPSPLSSRARTQKIGRSSPPLYSFKQPTDDFSRAQASASKRVCWSCAPPFRHVPTGPPSPFSASARLACNRRQPPFSCIILLPVAMSYPTGPPPSATDYDGGYPSPFLHRPSQQAGATHLQQEQQPRPLQDPLSDPTRLLAVYPLAAPYTPSTDGRCLISPLRSTRSIPVRAEISGALVLLLSSSRPARRVPHRCVSPPIGRPSALARPTRVRCSESRPCAWTHERGRAKVVPRTTRVGGVDAAARVSPPL